jgi:hypothetical protein
LLLGGLVWYLEPLQLWARLQQMEGKVLWAALACGGMGMGVQWIKWQRLLRPFRPQTTWGEGLSSLLVGFGLGLLSPGRVGELGRGVMLGGRQSTWVGLSAVDRACSATLSVALGWVGLLALHPPLALGILVGGLLLAAGLIGAWSRLRDWLGRWEWLAGAAAVAGQIPRTLWLQICLWSALFNLIFFVQFYLLLSGWEALPWGVVWGVPLFFGLKVLLPFSIMEIGVREGVALLVFIPLHLDQAVVFNAAFLQFLLNVLVPGVAGWVLLYWQLHRRLGRGASLKGLLALYPETRR